MPPKKAQSSTTSTTSKPSKRAKVDADAGRALTKEEEEEMSSALIAQLLAQEGGEDQHGYYAEYNNYASYDRYGQGGRSAEASDDDDDYRNDYYRPKSKSKRVAKSSSARTKSKAAPAPAPEPAIPKSKKAKSAQVKSTEPIVSITSAAPINKDSTTALTSQTNEEQATTGAETDTSNKPAPEKKTKEAPAGMNTGVYSEAEEKAFVEALELFGRNWRKVEEHVRTRDSNSIRSHAQKHFIKLFRDNIPLPPKILETGPGYTLSGRDLDPYSAAAMPYLSQRHFDDPSLLPKQGGQVFTPPDGASRKADKIKKEKETKPAKEASEDGATDATKEMKELKIRKSSKPKETTVRSRADSPPSEPSFAPVGRTDYSKARLRSTRDRPTVNMRHLGSGDLDPLTMVKCESFCGLPNSGVAGCQPFSITIQSNVLLGMDFHAHLMTAEIIGFLAGTWDAKTKTIHIQAIFPCRSLQTGQNHVNVEMDPTSEFEVRQEIEKRQMRVVGWYHSHPTFTPDPSLVDIENQASYQNLFKDEIMGEEPFVGAIVGPYDELLPGLSSVINWFYISHSPQERGQPKRLHYELIENTELPEQEASLWVKLFDEYRDSPERTNFQEQWRQEESETKLQKMLVSLGRRMPWLRQNLLKTKGDNGENVQQAEVGEQESSEKTGSKVTAATGDPASDSTTTSQTDVTESSSMEGVEMSKDETTLPEAAKEQASTAEEVSYASNIVIEIPATNMHRSHSNSSSNSNGHPGLGELVKDAFLMRVEQELSSWEPFKG
ncbi:hypothetical protein BGZ94_002190 [Podila epigama]|nr:hypothetical protein BGZ94_002190 [Podila epigama]